MGNQKRFSVYTNYTGFGGPEYHCDDVSELKKYLRFVVHTENATDLEEVISNAITTGRDFFYSDSALIDVYSHY